jgi:hypothetical protein
MEHLKRFAIGCAIGLGTLAVYAMVCLAGTALIIAIATNPELVIAGFALVFVLIIGVLYSLLGG